MTLAHIVTSNLSLYIQLKAKTVKADFEGLPSSVRTRFEADMKECYNWNGEFKKKRKKRGVGEKGGEDGVEDGGIARLPGNLLNWARDLLPRFFFRTSIFLLDIH